MIDLFKTMDDVPAEAGDGITAGGSGDLPAADPALDATPEPAGDMLPADMMGRKVLMPKSGGKDPMTVIDVMDYGRRAWQASATKDVTIGQLRADNDALQKHILANQVRGTEPPAGGVADDEGGYMDPASKQILTYVQKLGDNVKSLQDTAAVNHHAESQRALAASNAQSLQREKLAFAEGIKEFEKDITTNADVTAVISEAMNIRQNSLDPEEIRMFKDNPVTLYKKAAKRVVGEIHLRVEEKVKSRLMELRDGLEAGDNAKVEEAGGGAPLPKGDKKRTLSTDEKAKKYADKYRRGLNTAKASALSGGN